MLQRLFTHPLFDKNRFVLQKNEAIIASNRKVPAVKIFHKYKRLKINLHTLWG